MTAPEIIAVIKAYLATHESKFNELRSLYLAQ